MPNPGESEQAQSQIEILVRFSRLVSGVDGIEMILPMLADAAITHLGADAAAVLMVDAGGRVLVKAGRGLPEEFSSWSAESEVIGDDLGERLRAAAGERYGRSHMLPLVSSGDLFGALVLLFERHEEIDPARMELAEGLADLAAIALGKEAQVRELSRSYAELRASREILAKSEKLRALGQMAAGVSHDLKNILHPLLLQVQNLRRKVEKGEDAAPVVDRMEAVLRRGVETVERLRHFSRQAPEALAEVVDINALVHEAIELCAPRLRTQEIALRENLGSPPRVKVSGAELVAALVNLLVNAIDALHKGGEIKVHTGASDGGAFVEIEDSGPGIPEEVRPHVFEPFFTTKGKEGTGLGLSMVYALMQRCGGRISFETSEAGTTFTLWFPSAGRMNAK